MNNTALSNINNDILKRQYNFWYCFKVEFYYYFIIIYYYFIIYFKMEFYSSNNNCCKQVSCNRSYHRCRVFESIAVKPTSREMDGEMVRETPWIDWPCHGHLDHHPPPPSPHNQNATDNPHTVFEEVSNRVNPLSPCLTIKHKHMQN